ncbi:MAG TPA: hypothetical protein VH796_08135 [Nitrososphaeraceae archaeon]|jgi:uncharacterized membrane protein
MNKSGYDTNRDYTISESALLVQISNNIVLVIEIIAIVIITGIVGYFLVMFARVSIAKIRCKKVSFSLHDIIFRFLRGLLISLDFVIAADIFEDDF